MKDGFSELDLISTKLGQRSQGLLHIEDVIMFIHLNDSLKDDENRVG